MLTLLAMLYPKAQLAVQVAQVRLEYQEFCTWKFCGLALPKSNTDIGELRKYFGRLGGMQ